MGIADMVVGGISGEVSKFSTRNLEYRLTPSFILKHVIGTETFIGSVIARDKTKKTILYDDPRQEEVNRAITSYWQARFAGSRHKFAISGNNVKIEIDRRDFSEPDIVLAEERRRIMQRYPGLIEHHHEGLEVHQEAYFADILSELKNCLRGYNPGGQYTYNLDVRLTGDRVSGVATLRLRIAGRNKNSGFIELRDDEGAFVTLNDFLKQRLARTGYGLETDERRLILTTKKDGLLVEAELDRMLQLHPFPRQEIFQYTI